MDFDKNIQADLGQNQKSKYYIFVAKAQAYLWE
jgi:hypothetical protein